MRETTSWTFERVLDVPRAWSGQLARSARLGRREIFIWIAAALVGNELLQLVDVGSAWSLVASLETQNYVLWLAGYAVVSRVRASSAELPADRLDCWFSAATCVAILLTSLLPHRWGLGFVATTTSIYLLFEHRGDRNLRAAGYLLLAISAHLLWAPVLFQLATPEFVRADAAIVAVALKILRPDILWSGTTFHTPDGHNLILIGACSSFQNISIALLACTTVTMLSRTQWVREDMITVALATATMVIINAGRLCVLAWSASAFKFWHDGDGVGLFVFGQTAIVMLIAWRGAVMWKRAQ